MQCNTEAVDPNLRSPYVGTWTLDLQRAITNSLSVEVAYVGNHGTKFLGFQDINQPLVGAGFPGVGSLTGTALGEVAWCNANDLFTTPAASIPKFKGAPIACDPGDSSKGAVQAARPFNTKSPYLAQIDRLANLDMSNYSGLQVTLTERAMHGLSFTGGYTYAHALDDASANFNANPLPPNSYNPKSQYGNSDFDIRHRFTLTASYALPGKKSLGQMLEGWQLNSVITLQTGSPWTPQDTSNDFPGNGQVTELDSYGQFWNFTGNRADFTSSRNPIPCWSGAGGAALSGCAIGAGVGAGTPPPAACMNAATTTGQMNTLLDVGCYFQGNSALTPPALGTIGNSGRNPFRDGGYKNWDLSVTKNWTFKERLTTQFRAEFFNILNHPIFTNPNGPAGAGFADPSGGVATNFGCGCNTPDQASPNPVLGDGRQPLDSVGSEADLVDSISQMENGKGLAHLLALSI